MSEKGFLNRDPFAQELKLTLMSEKHETRKLLDNWGYQIVCNFEYGSEFLLYVCLTEY